MNDDDILKQLQELNETANKILIAVTTPKSFPERIADVAATGVGILGILGVADIIRNWIIGG